MEVMDKSYFACAAICVFLIVLFLSALYAGAYFQLGTFEPADPNSGYSHYRFYRQEWMLTAFEPMAKIESALTGESVWIGLQFEVLETEVIETPLARIAF